MSNRSRIVPVIVGGASANPLVSVGVGAVLLGGGYYAIWKLTGWNPLGSAWTGFIDSIKNIAPGGGVGSAKVTLNPSSGTHGTTFLVSVSGLKGATPTKYGWINSSNATIFETEFNADLDGSFNFQELVLDSTPTGKYTIYFDQRAWGGPYYQSVFTVVA